MIEKNSEGNLDSDFKKIQDDLLVLKKTDFELSLLALLTSKGLKPLSRWEKPLTDNELVSLQKIGLLTKKITRTVKTGKEVFETVFSMSPAYIKLYQQRFENTPIDKSTETQRFEGFLFGYPPCCIEQYIRKPYAPNDLEEKEQEILFHWACKDCKVTPLLLDSYKSFYDALSNLE
jgi:hypothetical protein